MKTILLLILVLLSIYLFSETGTQNPNGYKQVYHNGDTRPLSKSLPSRTNLMFAVNDISSYNNTTPGAAQQDAAKEPEKPTQHNKLSVFPNAKDGELWVQAENDADVSELDVQIYNSSGERVYYSKLDANLKKVNLCNYENGKYLIKVGGQTYRMMLIQ